MRYTVGSDDAGDVRDFGSNSQLDNKDQDTCEYNPSSHIYERISLLVPSPEVDEPIQSPTAHHITPKYAQVNHGAKTVKVHAEDHQTSELC